MSSTLKRSKQRDAIIAFLMTRKDHPTADLVYSNLRKDFPNISLGTVYRNLSLLSDRGEILKLSFDGKADHFDGTVIPHYHFICKDCGCVQDLEMETDNDLLDKASRHFDGKLDGCISYFYGLCNNCLNK